jgi:hypothetical protein
MSARQRKTATAIATTQDAAVAVPRIPQCRHKCDCLNYNLVYRTDNERQQHEFDLQSHPRCATTKFCIFHADSANRSSSSKTASNTVTSDSSSSRSSGNTSQVHCAAVVAVEAARVNATAALSALKMDTASSASSKWDSIFYDEPTSFTQAIPGISSETCLRNGKFKKQVLESGPKMMQLQLSHLQQDVSVLLRQTALILAQTGASNELVNNTFAHVPDSSRVPQPRGPPLVWGRKRKVQDETFALMDQHLEDKSLNRICHSVKLLHSQFWEEPVQCKTDSFVFTKAISGALYSTSSSGFLYLCLSSQTHPFTPFELQASGYDSVFSGSTLNRFRYMTLFNYTEVTNSENIATTQMIDRCHYKSAEVFLDQFDKLDGAGNFKIVAYREDVKDRSIWQRAKLPCLDSSIIPLPQTVSTSAHAEWFTYSFSDYPINHYRRLSSGSTSVAPHHTLNTLTYARHSRSLLSLLPDATLPPSQYSINLSESWTLLILPGVTSSSLSLSHSGQFTPLQFRTNFFPFINCCLSGESVWYLVRESEKEKLKHYMIARFKSQHPELSPFSVEEDFILSALLYAKDVCFFDPRDLVKYGIQVEQLNQRANEVFIGKGTVFRWGMTLHHYSVNETIDFVPVDWLLDGLPQTLDYLQWLLDYIAHKRKLTPAAAARLEPILQRRVEPNLGYIVPLEWTLGFVHYVLADVLKARDCAFSDNHSQPSPILPTLEYKLGLVQYDVVIAQLRTLESLLLHSDIAEFYRQHAATT